MSRDNFLYWKELAGLEKCEFPHLKKLEDTDIEKAIVSTHNCQEILDTIATNTFVDIQVRPGWGATTLYKYMLKKIKDGKSNLVISFDFEQMDFDDVADTEEKFIFHVKWQMAKGLADLMLKEFLPERYMYEVFNYIDDGKDDFRKYLRKKRTKFDAYENKIEEFYREFPFFKQSTLIECFNFFLTNFRIQTVFCYLFPRKVDEDEVFEFIGNIKNIFDGKEDIFPAAYREVYFLTPLNSNILKECYSRPYKDLTYKQYTAAELYSMLVNTYHPSRPLNATLSNVFNQEFVIQAYDKQMTMDEIMNRVEEEIEEVLDCEPSDVPYELTMRKV